MQNDDTGIENLSTLAIGATASTPLGCEVQPPPVTLYPQYTPSFPNNFSLTSELDSTLLGVANTNNNISKSVDISSALFYTAQSFLQADDEDSGDEEETERQPSANLRIKAKKSYISPVARRTRSSMIRRRFVDVGTSPMTPYAPPPPLPSRFKTSKIPLPVKRLQRPSKHLRLSISIHPPSATSTPLAPMDSSRYVPTPSASVVGGSQKNTNKSKYQVVRMKPFLLKRKSEVLRDSNEQSLHASTSGRSGHDGGEACGCRKGKGKRRDTPTSVVGALTRKKNKALLLMSSIHEELNKSGVHCNITGNPVMTETILQVVPEEEEGGSD